MNWDPVSRRHFLRGAGGFALTLPVLPSLLWRDAVAAGPAKKRFLAIHSGHCQAVEQWLPDHTRIRFTEAAGQFAREVSLSSIQGNVSPIFAAAYDATLRSKMLILGRLDPTSTSPNHNAEVVLSGGTLNEIPVSTLDHVLARKLSNSAPLNLYIRSVFDQGYDGASALSANNRAYSKGLFNPSAVFANLFGTGGGGGPDAGATRRSVAAVDRVFKEFQSLRQGRALSGADKQRLDQHMQLIADVEAKLKANAQTSTQSCSNVAGPARSPVFTNVASDYGVVIDQMFDVIEVAFKCGRVQVATLMLHVYDYFAGSIGFIPGINGNVKLHEDVGHAGSNEFRQMKLALNRYFGERVARFLKRLDNTVEDPATGLTYLDNSLILWSNDQGTLNNTNAHASVNQPVMLAGKAGGFLKTGKYVDYGPAYEGRALGGDEGQYRRGRPYNQLLITIAQAMGLAPADYESGGTQGFGVYGQRTSTHDYLPGNHRRDPLPLIT